jgi:hypothetical protein
MNLYAHDCSYMRTEYAQTKMIEEYNREAKVEHTPGPWKAYKNEEKQFINIFANSEKDGKIADRVAYVLGVEYPDTIDRKAEANAAFIVRACNCHDELLAACKAALVFINNGVALGYIRMPDPDTPDTAHNTPIMLRAAIAKAEA